MDKHSFILGMVAGFCECVAADCKPLALSPPLTDDEYTAVCSRATDMILQHGLRAYHEENADLPAPDRCHWIVLYAREEALDAYLSLRAAGHNPRRGLAPFAAVLGYGPNRIVTGYDAFHAFFPPTGDASLGKPPTLGKL